MKELKLRQQANLNKFKVKHAEYAKQQGLSKELDEAKSLTQAKRALGFLGPKYASR